MERESFESDQVARILNESFVSIKIDREERPDIDRIYMSYVQATTGSGGWPLNVFLTPDLEPIFGGTYWPGPNSNILAMRRGQAGFLDILKKVNNVWEHQQDRCRRNAKEILKQLKDFTEEGSHSRHGPEPDADGLELDLLEEAYQHYAKKYDALHGGFAGKGPGRRRPRVTERADQDWLRSGAQVSHSREPFVSAALERGTRCRARRGRTCRV